MEKVQTLIEELASLPGWEERYEYVIELGRALPDFDKADMTSANLVQGCTSTVYLTLAWDEQARLKIALTSDALIVNGLLALVYAAYNGKSRQAAKEVDLTHMLAGTALLEHLSPNRRHGFAAVIGRVSGFISA